MAHQDTIQCGSFQLKWNERITEMDDCTEYLQNNHLSTLRSKLHSDGYIFLRNQIPTDLIDNALHTVAHSLHSNWDCVDLSSTTTTTSPTSPQTARKTVDDLYIKPNCNGILLTGYKPITHHKAVLSLLHCEPLVQLMYKVFACEPVTYDTKWLRVKGTKEFTDEHSDYYRFAGDCTQMLTVWMPLMDIPISKGPLAVCPKSHRLNFEQHQDYEYGMESKSDTELPSDFEQFNQDAIWKTTNFQKGDLLIFDIRTVHASITNETDRFRVSIDTRWQPRNVISFWNDAYIRFPEVMQKVLRNFNVQRSESVDKEEAVTEQKEMERESGEYTEVENEKKSEGDADEVDHDLEDMMMDCTFSDSDNDVIDQLDFEAISKRLCQKTHLFKQSANNNNHNDCRTSFV